MCDTAGVNYIEVMDYLGENYLDNTIFTENNLPNFKANVQNAIYYVLNGVTNDTLSLIQISSIVANLCDSAGIDSSLIWMELGDYLYSRPFLHSDIPEIESNIIKVISGLQYSIVPFEVVLEIIGTKSHIAQVDTFLVIEEMGGYNYIKYRTWYKKDLPLLEERIDEAIKKVLNINDTTKIDSVNYDNLKTLLYNLSEMYDVNYMEVMDSMYVLPDPNKLYSINEIPSFTIAVFDQIQIIKKNFDKDKLNYEDMKNLIYVLSIIMEVPDDAIYDSLYDEYLTKNTIDRSLILKFTADIINISKSL